MARRGKAKPARSAKGAPTGRTGAARRAGARTSRPVRPVPRGYRTVTPYLTVDDAAQAIDFYTRAFGAREKERMPGPGGKIMHAELEIGDSVIMLADEFPGMGTARAPRSLGGTTSYVFLYVPDVDQTFRRALDAGARVEMPLTDMFWGDRFGKVVDPFGHTWGMATHREDVSPEEMERRQREAMAAMAKRSD